MQIDMSRFRATFFVEAAEHLEHMEAALLQLENMPDDSELLNTVFRAAHSIKGASTTFGMEEIGRFTHVCENLLDRMRDGLISVNSDVVEVLLSSVDVIQGLVAAAKDGVPLPENLESTLAELNRINGSGGTVATSTSQQAIENVAPAQQRKVRVTFAPSYDFFRFGQEPSLILREFYDLGEVTAMTLDRSRLPVLEDMDPESCYLAWSIELDTTADDDKLGEVFMFLDDASTFQIENLTSPSKTPDDASQPDNVPNENGSTPASATAPTNDASAEVNPERTAAESREPAGANNRPPVVAAESETVRVDRARLDEMINQIGELVIGTSMVQQELRNLTGGAESVAMDQLAKIVRDLQEMSLSLRMIPIAATFQKMARVVRDLARKLDKKIDFTTEGEDTELDKSVVDQIGDPLVHMVRNAADHGVETVEERLASGKSATGSIHLKAYQQSGNIFIEIRDDGRGLDRDRILRKAIERGLVSSDAQLSDNEISNLIFEPGFSTAEKVTDVSGRGVGMDVVRRNVEALQGSVSIRSEAGRGSVITVRLPLTLAILDGLLVRLDEEVYVLPLLAVVETISVQQGDINLLAGGGEVVVVRGEVLPVIWLRRVLNVPSNTSEESAGLLVIIEEQGRRFALVVDDLMGQQQVVIKSLETNFQKVPGVAGATILGNGRIALILDPFAVASLSSIRPALSK